MTDVGIHCPPEWTERPDEERDENTLVQWQHTTVDGITFLVSLIPRADGKAYNLRLSTINPTTNPVRHDYPVKEYDSREAACAGIESLASHVSERLQEGSISSTDPEIKEMWATIRAFSDGGLFPSLSRLLSLVR